MTKFLMRYAVALTALFVGVEAGAQTTKWRDIHEVKKKETIFGIARDYGLTVDELIEANPEMKTPGYLLKKGTTIFVPYPKGQGVETSAVTGNAATQAVGGKVKPAPQVKEPAQGSYGKDDVRNRAIRVGVMLPLHDNDGDGRRMVEYYRGLLLACDRVKKDGISVEVSAWNVPQDADIRQTLLEKDASRCDIIFGPLYTKMVKPLADFCRTYGIKLVIPFSISGNDVESNNAIFQVWQTPEELNDQAISRFLQLFQNAHPVFVDCNDPQSTKGPFTFGLRKQLDAKKISYGLTNLTSSEADFARAFDQKKQNVVIVNTGRSPELNSTLAKLNSLTQKVQGLKIALYGYTDWLMYAKVYQELFFKYEAYIPTTFYYNPLSTDTKWVETNYRNWFHSPMMESGLPRFALTGFDQGCFFLGGLHKYGKAFTGQKGESTYRPVQTPFRFKRVGQGGEKNATFMIVHYKHDKTIESLNY